MEESRSGNPLKMKENMEGGEFLGESLERGLGGPARRGRVKKNILLLSYEELFFWSENVKL